jgi:hypothetical protein
VWAIGKILLTNPSDPTVSAPTSSSCPKDSEHTPRRPALGNPDFGGVAGHLSASRRQLMRPEKRRRENQKTPIMSISGSHQKTKNPYFDWPRVLGRWATSSSRIRNPAATAIAPMKEYRVRMGMKDSTTSRRNAFSAHPVSRSPSLRRLHRTLMAS